MSSDLGASEQIGEISSARVRVFTANDVEMVAMSFSSLERRALIAVELNTSDGLVGFGESWANFPEWAPVERIATLREGVLPLLRGQSPIDAATCSAYLRARLEPLGRQWGAPGPIIQALSAIDVALWDLLGRRSGLSVSALAGRVRDSVPAYASGLGPNSVAASTSRCLLGGYRSLKVKVGFGIELDRATLHEIRRIYGDDLVLYADANQAWDLSTAIAMGPLLREARIAWIEEPIAGNSLSELEEFYSRTGVPVATGENMYGLDSFEEFAESEAIQVLQPDVSKNGGLTELFEIDRIATKFGKQLIPHLYGGAIAFAGTLQAAGACSAISAIEYDIRDNPLRDRLWPEAPRPIAGCLAIPNEPGIGLRLELDDDAVSAWGGTDTRLMLGNETPIHDHSFIPEEAQ